MIFKTGDILLVDTEGFIPSKIDVFQGNDYNHAGFIIHLKEQCYVFEAVAEGMVFTPIEEYLKRTGKEDLNLLVLRLKNNYWDHMFEGNILNFLLPLTKKRYGYCNLLIFQAIKYITKKLGCEVWIGRSKEKSTKKFICGKLVAYIYNHYTGMFKDWHTAAPVDLFDSVDFKHIKVN